MMLDGAVPVVAYCLLCKAVDLRTVSAQDGKVSSTSLCPHENSA